MLTKLVTHQALDLVARRGCVSIHKEEAAPEYAGGRRVASIPSGVVHRLQLQNLVGHVCVARPFMVRDRSHIAAAKYVLN